MTRRKTQSHTNGHAGSNGRVNSHGPASTGRGGVPAHRDRAASDDANGAAVANTASSASAAGTDREACAEVAPSRAGKKNGKLNNRSKSRSNGKNSEGQKLRNFLLAGPTDFAAMQDGSAYVNAVAARIDLVGASVCLVGADDEKIAKSELDRLREMKFGKIGAAVVEELPRADFGDLPRPER